MSRGNSTSPDPELELVRDFINTRDIDEATDAVAAPAQLAAWVEGRASIPTPVPEREEHARALELREGLRALVLANNKGTDAVPSALAPLAAAAARARIEIALDGGGLELRSEPGGLAAFEARLLLAIADAQARGSWPRLKACTAGDCQWAFYDESRNRSRTWCSMEVCGNRSKTRFYRHRRGEEGEAAGGG